MRDLITRLFDSSEAFVGGGKGVPDFVLLLFLGPFPATIVYSLGFPDLGAFFAAIEAIVGAATAFLELR